MKRLSGWGYRVGTVSLLIIPILLAAGCATRQDLLQVDEKVNQIRNDQLILSAKLDRVDSLLINGSNQDNRLRVEVSTALNQLTEQLAQMQNQMADLQQIVYRTGQGSSNRAPQPLVDSTKNDTTKAKNDSIGTSSSVDCHTLWDNAFKDMRRGQYDLAIAGFSDYLRYCPTGELCDNSQYWIAEAYYEMKQYKRAIEEYDRLLKQYPESEKRPTAYFKLGRAYEELGNKDKALEYYLALKKEYPTSLEYEQVKSKIETWQKKPKKS